MCQKTVLAVEGIPVSVLCRGRWKGVNQRQLRRLCSLWWQKPEGCVPLNNSPGLQGGDSGNDAPQEGASFVQLGIVGCGAGKKKKKLSAAPSILSSYGPDREFLPATPN